MTTFKEHFSEVQHYDEGYGYVTDAKDVHQAVDKIVEYLSFSDLSDRKMNRLKRELRENMKNCWARFQGWQDEWDRKLYNTWVVTSEYHGGQPRYFHVFSTDYDSHYVYKGHRFEPVADEPGNRVAYGYSSCEVCNQIDMLKKRIDEAASSGSHACYCPRSVDSGCECALKEKP